MPSLPLEGQSSAGAKEVFHNRWSKTKSMIASRSNSSSHSKSLEWDSNIEEHMEYTLSETASSPSLEAHPLTTSDA